MVSEVIETEGLYRIKSLCQWMKEDIENKNYKVCAQIIAYSMYLHPSAPEPHNLLGILLEKEGHHADAMKHFRASLDLDPAYAPALQNMMISGTFYSDKRAFAYDEDDCVRYAQQARLRKAY